MTGNYINALSTKRRADAQAERIRALAPLLLQGARLLDEKPVPSKGRCAIIDGVLHGPSE